MLLPCTHQFHGKCILAWVEHNFSCPLCRQVIGQFVPLIPNEEIHTKFTEAWEAHYLHKPTEPEEDDAGRKSGGKLGDGLGKESGSVEESLPTVVIPLEESDDAAEAAAAEEQTSRATIVVLSTQKE